MVPSCFLITLSQCLLKPNKIVQHSLQILLLFISDFIKPSLRRALFIIYILVANPCYAREPTCLCDRLKNNYIKSKIDNEIIPFHEFLLHVSIQFLLRFDKEVIVWMCNILRKIYQLVSDIKIFERPKNIYMTTQ